MIVDRIAVGRIIYEAGQLRPHLITQKDTIVKEVGIKEGKAVVKFKGSSFCVVLAEGVYAEIHPKAPKAEDQAAAEPAEPATGPGPEDEAEAPSESKTAEDTGGGAPIEIVTL